MSRCYIVGAGDCEKLNIKPKEGDLVMAADGGYKYLKRSKINCDIIIGDFDSMEKPDFKNVITLPKEKDVSDMEECMRYALLKGYKEFVLFGALGGERLSHTLANIQMLCNYTKKGLTITVVGNNEMVTAIHNDYIMFAPSMKGYISVIVHGDKAEGVNISGLKYTLDNATLTGDFALGLSNEFIGQEGKVEVKNGTLIIIFSKQK